MKRFKRIIVLLCGLLLVLPLCALGALACVRRIPVSTPDLSALPDGYYTGEYTLLSVRIQVEAELRGHCITGLRILRHDCGRGRRAEALLQAVLERQSLELDAVSGATVSSQCILKAIETALEKGATP